MSRNQQHTSIDLTTLYLKKSITIRIWVSQYQTIWNGHHINNICKKASSTVGFIRHNLKGTTIYHLTWRGGVWFFFQKKYSDSQCCWKNILILVEDKKKSDSDCDQKKKYSNSCVVRKKKFWKKQKTIRIALSHQKIWFGDKLQMIHIKQLLPSMNVNIQNC